MLARLSIRNYALIDDLDISFSPDLNILTGETGAGKSIILGALSLILGQRTESRYFYNQQKKCIIEGFFQVGAYGLKSFFDENDLDYEEETVLRREVSSDGKSRAFVNDSPVTLGILKQLGEQLIDIHSQHATLEINDERFQLLVVDALAGHDALLGHYKKTYADWRSAGSKLSELLQQTSQSKSDLDYFQFQYDELESAHLVEGEQDALEQELRVLSHAEEVKRNLSGALFQLEESESAGLSTLKETLSYLQQAAKYLPDADALAVRVQSALIDLKDVSAELGSLEQNTGVDERRTEQVNDRLNVLYSLEKKHRVSSVAELIAIQTGIAGKLEAILFSDEQIEQLKADVNRLKGELTELGETLSASRNEVIPSIEQKVAAILAEVGMPNAVLKVSNEVLPEGQFNRDGRNQLRFLFSANKGQEPAPMNKVASGGELSRVMLSIKSLISRHTALPTIIFDEIDTGISGETALKVGAIMERLSEGMQVIAITHLPQIASRGNAHYKVFKDEQGERTLTGITLLDDAARVREVAVMLSGANPGEFALQNAKELLGRSG